VRRQEQSPSGPSKRGRNPLVKSLVAVAEALGSRTDIDTAGFGTVRDTCSPDALSSAVSAAAAAIDDTVNRFQVLRV
jgi:hypothetical protein